VKPSVETFRAKLDAAIVAEAWDAVKAIRERIVELERTQAGNVVALRGGFARLSLAGFFESRPCVHRPHLLWQPPTP
jgi:hypothetical protein